MLSPKVRPIQWLFLSATALTVACGGSDEPDPAYRSVQPAPSIDGSSAVTAAQPRPTPASKYSDHSWLGAYGATTSGTTARTLIMATSAEYGLLGVYGVETATGFEPAGLLGAAGFSAREPIRYRVRGREDSAVQGDMTLDPSGPSIEGSFSTGSQQWQLGGGALSAPGYRFDQPAALDAVVGHWELTTSTGHRISMQVDATGGVTGKSDTCDIVDSKIAPTKSGYGVFAVTLRFMAPQMGCFEPHGLSDGVHGFAVVYSAASGDTQLVVVAENGWDPVFLAAAGKR